MKRLSKAQLDEIISVRLEWVGDLLLKWWNNIKEVMELTFGPGLIEGIVGVAVIVLSIAAVVFFICLCWGIVWKLLLSRLGLFRELISGNGNGNSDSTADKSDDRRPRSILVRERNLRPRPRKVEIREPEDASGESVELQEEEDKHIDGDDDGGGKELIGEVRSVRRRRKREDTN